MLKRRSTGFSRWRAQHPSLALLRHHVEAAAW